MPERGMYSQDRAKNQGIKYFVKIKIFFECKPTVKTEEMDGLVEKV